MPIIVGFILAVVMLWATLSFFRVRCPKGFALVVTRRTQLVDGLPTVTFVLGGTVYRTYSVIGINTLDLRDMTVEAFIPTDSDVDDSTVMHAEAVVHVGTTPEQLESAAVRLLGMTHSSIGNVVEGVLSSSLHDVIKHMRHDNAGLHLGEIESQVTKDFAEVLQTMGLHVTKLKVQIPNTRGFRCTYRKLGAPAAQE